LQVTSISILVLVVVLVPDYQVKNVNGGLLMIPAGILVAGGCWVFVVIRHIEGKSLVRRTGRCHESDYRERRSIWLGFRREIRYASKSVIEHLQ